MKIYKTISLNILLILTSSANINLNAQTNYIFTRYSQEEGLASSSIISLGKDSSGFLWLMSEDGLTRFDGYSFKEYRYNPNDSNGISSSTVYSMASDSTGNIVFLTSNWLCKYNRGSDSFKKLYPVINKTNYNLITSGKDRIWAVASNKLLCIDAANDKVYDCTLPDYFEKGTLLCMKEAGGQLVLNNASITINYNPADKTFSRVICTPPPETYQNSPLIPDAKGIIYTLTDKGICKYDVPGKRFDPVRKLFFTTAKKTNSFYYQGFIGDGAFLVETAPGEFYIIDIKTNTERQYHFSSSSGEHTDNSSCFITSCVVMNDGSLWIGTRMAGLFHLYPQSGSFQQFVNQPGNNNSISSDFIGQINKDGENVLWMTCVEKGLVKLECLNPTFTSYAPRISKEISSCNYCEHIRAFAERDSDHLFVGTLGGLFEFSVKNKNFYRIPSSQITEKYKLLDAISSMTTDKRGNVFLANWNLAGFDIIDFESNGKIKGRNHYSPLPGSGIARQWTRCLFIDTKENLWLGTNEGPIYRIPLQTLYSKKTSEIKFESLGNEGKNSESVVFNNCFAFAEDRMNRIWIGTQQGLYRYDYNSGKFDVFSSDIRNPKSLSSNNIRSFCLDHYGNMWIGTAEGGLNRYNEKSNIFHSYTTKDGLPNDAIYSILEDDKGFLWLGTNKGLCRFDPQTLRCRNYSLKDGIQNYEYNTGASLKLTNGNLVLGGRSGFNIIDPGEIATISSPPRIRITEFNVLNKERIIDTNEVILKHYENYISFQLAVLDNFRSQENQYAYMLENLDEKWVYSGNRRYVSYANLAPGDYIFKAKGANSFGVWNEEGISLKIHIGTPWWSTWWFRLAILVLLFIIVYSIYSYRMQQKMKIIAIRDRIAGDLHDEIGSTLSSIALYSEVAQNMIDSKVPEAKSLLSNISENTSNMMEAMSDIVWTLNTRNDKFDNIENKMRAFAIEIFDVKGVNVHMEHTASIQQVKLDMEQRKNLYFIFKEAVNNAAKYAHCRNIWIELMLNNPMLKMKIKDDGQGFNISEKENSGNGLRSMRKRAEELKGSISIISEPGKGTSIELKFPI